MEDTSAVRSVPEGGRERPEIVIERHDRMAPCQALAERGAR
jgi:hypothetical protein